MRFVSIVHEAWKALARHKLRSSLSVLGISVGIAAVVCTVAIGNAGAIALQAQLLGLGENLVWVEAGGRTRDGVRTGNGQTKTLIMDDVLAIRREMPLILRAAPQVDGKVQVIRGNRNWNTTIRGITAEYFEVRRFVLAAGGLWTQEDVDFGQNVCILGSTVAEKLFDAESPVGQTMRVGHLTCRVLGVLYPKGQSPTGTDYDDQIFMPYSTVQRKITGVTWLNDILCSAVSRDAIAQAEEEVTALMRQRHHIGPGDPDDFNIRHPEDLVQAQASATRTYMAWMGSVAAIALLVGGVGIMNIMFVSASERTREIGIRLAIGARSRTIQLQFLSEAMLLGLLGGSSGILIGVAGAWLLSRFTEWQAQISGQAIAIAAALSVAIGVLAGYYPARKAAGLDPIQALRSE